MSEASNDFSYLAANWADVRARVDAACHAAGRDPGEVSILPVSKTFGPEVVRAAMALGLHRFGENKVQEVRSKSEALAGESVEWVVIGHLQTNKAKDVARLVSEVQSLDRLELAEVLQRRLEIEDRAIDVLVEVKTSPEESKHGLAPDQLSALLDALRGFDRLRVRGLMTLAVQSDDSDAVRTCFRRLRQLRDAEQARGHDLPRLSMGMSGDFPLAIAEGATEIRVGTAVFGVRQVAKHTVPN
ncbi:YggS family pyridoxal phosphate-dependent enzyme [Dyella telluris]|uniref:Pyridoxal phosphate homeostasis protein n=1 Tax=Dyella telluris TaxID=2763498 RepID=A0A7G8Q120_9GAMM|nr:YggS family pyridoxal phosphate-dependent enzyme [Dyella telluris]QNK00478.1 YggS family pyridoxal phosphate-dependent enzyme [Dyella telluris]